MERRPGRVEADVARDRARIAQPRREAAASRAWSSPRQAQLVEQAVGERPMGRRSAWAASQRGRARPSRGVGRGKPVHLQPYAIVTDRMQTSLARRQRRRRNGSDRGSGGGGAASGAAIALPLLPVRDAGPPGDRRASARCVAAYSLLQPGPARSRCPSSTTSTFSQETVVYDRTGTIELARFGAIKRDGDPLLADDPARADRRDHQHRGQDVLAERRLRPDRDPVGGLRHGHRQGPRCVHDHPAARPRPAAARQRLRRLDLRTQDPGDHPVDPADPGAAARRSPASRRSWRPTSTRTSTATRATASRRPPRATSGSPT